MKRKIIILGAGLAGLSCAYKLTENNSCIIVLEKNTNVGGLAKSVSHKDFVFDLGPHRFHTEDSSILHHVKNLLGNELNIKNRQSEIYIDGKYFSYPLQAANVLSNLPLWTLFESLINYILIQTKNIFIKSSKDSFEQWAISRFGKTLYNLFFKNYTEKLWGIPCTQLSSNWGEQRIRSFSLWQAGWAMLHHKNTPTPYTSSQFYYPQNGGIGKICERYKEILTSKGQRIYLNTYPVKLFRTENKITKIVYSQNGNVFSIDKPAGIVSTIPITNLIELFEPKSPRIVLDAAKRLKYRSIILIFLMINRSQITQNHWVYFPQKEVHINRFSEFRNFSQFAAPLGQTGLCAEITCDYEDKIWGEPPEKLIEIAINDLASIGLIKAEQVVNSFILKERYAYPIYKLGYQTDLNTCLSFINNIRNLITCGRQGLFRYNNMDHSIDMGLKAAESIINGNYQFEI